MSDSQDSGIASPSQSRRSSTASEMSTSQNRAGARPGMQGVARNPSQDRRRRGSSGQGHGQGVARNPSTDRRRRGNRSQSAMGRSRSRSTVARSAASRSTMSRSGASRSRAGARSGMQGVARNPSQDRRRRGSSGQGHGQGIARNPSTDRRRRGNRSQSAMGRSRSTARRSTMSRSTVGRSAASRSTMSRSGVSRSRAGARSGMQGVARNPSQDRRRRANRSQPAARRSRSTRA